MVRKHLLQTLLLASLFLAMFLSSASAWSGSYHIEKQWSKIWINQDGTIDLFYNITLAHDSGDDINYITVGQPNSDFTVGNPQDQYGNLLTAESLIQGSDYKVKVNLHSPLHAGQKIWFTLTTNVGGMIYNDSSMNPGYLGMEFIPCWWPVTVQDLRVAIVLPAGVAASMVRTYRDWNNTFTEGDQLVVYWEAQNLSPNAQYTVGVAFPQEYMPNYKPPSVEPPPDGYPPPVTPSFDPTALLIVLFVFGAIGFSVLVGVFGGKHNYFAPMLSMETLGIRRGLTAVEASYILDMKPTKIVTEILYSLLYKRAVWVEAVKPSLKLRIMQKFQSPQARKELLRYYETDCLNAIKPEGNLDEVKLAQAIMTLRDTVEDKMRGYCRRDTIAYYKSVVAKAWEQVEHAGTPELASNAYDEQLLWLLLDPEVKMRTNTVFLNRPFMPDPTWFWYWYGYRHYHPSPTYTPTITVPTAATPTAAKPTAATPTATTPVQVAKPPAVPGADFANNIATSLEQTANNIVVNLERFANAIIPMQPARQSHQPVHSGASCVCACHACACACACVSCACACAGGGVG
jgi:hypothetical protein